jgi:hypothetical protein
VREDLAELAFRVEKQRAFLVRACEPNVDVDRDSLRNPGAF